MERYILNDAGEPVECPDLLTWGRWMENGENRVVAKTEVADGVRVSTVFLGLNHTFVPGQRLLWETMVFGGPHDGLCERYESRAAAEFGHGQVVDEARKVAAVDPHVDSNTGTPPTRD